MFRSQLEASLKEKVNKLTDVKEVEVASSEELLTALTEKAFFTRIKLKKDVALTTRIEIGGKNIFFDLNGHWLRFIAKTDRTTGEHVLSGFTQKIGVSSLIFYNGTIEIFPSEDKTAVIQRDYTSPFISVTVKNCRISATTLNPFLDVYSNASLTWSSVTVSCPFVGYSSPRIRDLVRGVVKDNSGRLLNLVTNLPANQF